MAKPKAIVISGPTDAKHVGGINVLASTQRSGMDVYFKGIAVTPDEPPLHTFVAVGKTEIPRRSDTIATSIRRPHWSLKRNASKLQRPSLSNIADIRLRHEVEERSKTAMLRTESTTSQRPLKAQPSMTRLRQRMGLDRELFVVGPTYKPAGQRPRAASADGCSTFRIALHSASTTPKPDSSAAKHATHRQSSLTQPPVAVGKRKPSLATKESSSTLQQPHITRQPSTSLSTTVPKARPRSQMARADSGTAIDFTSLPADERPLGFKDILAVKSFEDRMREYERARQYWRHADHGLMEWTRAAMKPQ